MIGTRCLCLMYLKSFLFSFFSFSTKEKKKYIQYIYTILSREERVEGNGITCSKRVRHLMIHHLTLEGNFISKNQNLTCFFPMWLLLPREAGFGSFVLFQCSHRRPRNQRKPLHLGLHVRGKKHRLACHTATMHTSAPKQAATAHNLICQATGRRPSFSQGEKAKEILT